MAINGLLVIQVTPSKRDYIYKGGCPNDMERAQCRQLRYGETKKCYENSYANDNLMPYGLKGGVADQICQRENTIHYPAQILKQIQGGTVPSLQIPMGNIYGSTKLDRTSCESGHSRILCAKGYQAGVKMPMYTTPCTRHQNWANYKTATDIGWRQLQRKLQWMVSKILWLAILCWMEK